MLEAKKFLRGGMTQPVLQFPCVLTVCRLLGRPLHTGRRACEQVAQAGGAGRVGRGAGGARQELRGKQQGGGHRKAGL